MVKGEMEKAEGLRGNREGGRVKGK